MQRTTRGGFTFVELIAAVLIVGILGAAAAPRLISGLAEARLKATRKRIQVDLKYAARAARTAGASRSVTFSTTSDSYTLTGIKDIDRPNATFTVSLAKLGIDLTAADVGENGDGEIVFDGYGRIDFGSDIVLRAGSLSSTLTIDGPVDD